MNPSLGWNPILTSMVSTSCRIKTAKTKEGGGVSTELVFPVSYPKGYKGWRESQRVDSRRLSSTLPCRPASRYLAIHG